MPRPFSDRQLRFLIIWQHKPQPPLTSVSPHDLARTILNPPDVMYDSQNPRSTSRPRLWRWPDFVVANRGIAIELDVVLVTPTPVLASSFIRQDGGRSSR